MGIQNLWKAVEGVGKTEGLNDIAYRLPVQGGRDLPCIGVDVSPCMDECIAATMPQGVNGRLPGGPLYIFFHKLNMFLGIRATFLFVFDGPNRPSVKRGSHVRHHFWWESIVKELILAFGFRFHQAPGEAEAELSMLNCNGAIDAVMTSDSDAFVFGAQHIIRPIPGWMKSSKKLHDDTFELYTEDSLQQVQLSRGGLVLFALLSGGDYHTGIARCGCATALGLAQSGFGDELLVACHELTTSQLNPTDFDQFIQEWCQSVCRELVTNSQGRLHARLPRIANSIENSDFPNHHILSLYVHPVVSMFRDLHTHSWHLIHEPALSRIRDFCHQQLQWTEEQVIRQKFNDVIFPAVVLRMLYSPLTLYNSKNQKLLGPTLQVTIRKVVWSVRKGRLGLQYRNVRQPRLYISTPSLLSLMGYSTPVTQDKLVRLWAPRQALPVELQPDFNGDGQFSNATRDKPNTEIIDLTRINSDSGSDSAQANSSIIDLTVDDAHD